MKKSIIINTLLSVICLSSCSTTEEFYQYCDITSNLKKNKSSQYFYSDNSCDVIYDFWSEGGNPGFTITNNSDQILYLDLSKSFFIRNGVSNDYWQDRTFTVSSSRQSSSTTAKAATAYGYWNMVGVLYPGSSSASVATGQQSSSGSSVSTKEKKIIAIAPNSCRNVYEYCLFESPLGGCEYNTMPLKNENPVYHFDDSDSPLVFSNYLTYTLGTDSTEYSFRNDFMVNGISFKNSRDALKEVTYDNCGKTITVKEIEGASPVRCYVRYQRVVKSSSKKYENEKSPWHRARRLNDINDIYN